MGIPIHLQHLLMVYHHQRRRTHKSKLLVAIQDYDIRFCAQLRYAWRTDGRRALPHNVALAYYRNRTSFVFRHTVRHDAHLQPFLVLDNIHRLISCPLSCRDIHGNITRSHKHILPARPMVLHRRISQRTCRSHDERLAPHSLCQRMGQALCHQTPATARHH